MIGIVSNTDLTRVRYFLPEFPLKFESISDSELLDRERLRDTRSPDNLLVFVSGSELLRGYYYRVPGEEIFFYVLSQVETLLRKIDGFLIANPDATMILGNVVFPPPTFLNQVELATTASLTDLECLINKKLSLFAETHRGLRILDWQQIVKTYGYANLFDSESDETVMPKLNHLAINEIGAAFNRLAELENSTAVQTNL